jgi:Spy/CpxP family protein refolding chaperone
MNTRKQRFFAAVLALAVLSIALPAMTLAGGSPSETDQRHAGSFNRRPPLRRLMAQLNLTTDQKNQIRNLVAKDREAFRALREQLAEKRLALKEAGLSTPPDEQLVRAKAQAVAAVHAEMMVARARLAREMLGVLTPEQSAKLDQLRRQHRQRHARWRERHVSQ